MRRRYSILSIAFAATLVGGCLGSFGTPGEPTGTSTGDGTGTGSGSGTGSGAQSGGGDGTTPTPTPDPTPTMPPAAQGSFTAALDKATDNIRLNETKSYTLTLTPADGLTGGVTLALDAPPAGVTAVFTPATVNITDANPVTVKVDVTVAPDMSVPSQSVPLSVKATSGDITASASLGVTIPAELLVEIQSGVDIGSSASPNKAAFGTYGMPVIQVAAGTKVTWINRDGINHEIHSDGNLGIAHETGPLMANGANSYTQTFNLPAGTTTPQTYSYRCHVHPNMLGQIIVKP
jgi:plastocyanin